MGHSDVKIAMTYQHPELEIVRAAINSRHTLRHTGKPQLRKLLILIGSPQGFEPRYAEVMPCIIAVADVAGEHAVGDVIAVHGAVGIEMVNMSLAISFNERLAAVGAFGFEMALG